MRCVTFNAAVVKEQNWRRLFRSLDRAADSAGKEPAADTIQALVMADDLVSKIGAAEERRYVQRIRIDPAAALAPQEQHGIRVIIEELERRLHRYRNSNPVTKLR